MKKIFVMIALLAGVVSCQSVKDEWTPVFTAKYANPDTAQIYEITPTHTIAQLVEMYQQGKPLEIKEDVIIGGVVTTTDQPGNFYKSLYIQDTTGGIELKIGKNGLYNDYLQGQMLYVKCKGLTIGCYGFKDNKTYGGNGMVSIGFSDPSGQYETSYLENSLLIDTHILKGKMVGLPDPVELTVSQLPAKDDTQSTNKNLGRYVKLKGLKYSKEVFCLIYLDSKLDKKSYTNRVFLSSSNVAATPTCGITTWAMSKVKMTEYLLSGIWDAYKIGSGSNYVMIQDPETGKMREKTLGDMKGDGTYPDVEKAAYSVSQYFTMGSKTIQIRTSGFGKFGDVEIDENVLDQSKTIDVTGIITLYEGSIQFIVNSIDDVVVND